MIRFEECDCTAKVLYAGTPFQLTSVHCPNTGDDYGIHFMPSFCPLCGGRPTAGARERYYAAAKEAANG